MIYHVLKIIISQLAFSFISVFAKKRKLRSRLLAGALFNSRNLCVQLLRAVCCKNRLKVCKIEKSDFLKICQNKGFGELVLKISVSGRLGFYLFFSEYFRILPCAAVKINAKIVIFPEAPVQIFKTS